MMFGKHRSSNSRGKLKQLAMAANSSGEKSAAVKTLDPPAASKRLSGISTATAPLSAAQTSPRRAGGADPAHSPGRTLMVGRDIALTGEVSSCEKLVVEGRLEGEVSETGTLEIRETGRVTGRAVVEACSVSGSFEGELTVNGLLHLRKDARVRGTIRYDEINIDRGGRLSGDIDFQRAREVRPSRSQPDVTPGAETAPDRVTENVSGREFAPGPGPKSA